MAPMRAVSGPVPVDDNGWAYEVKWDGMRIITTVTADGVRLASANGIDATVRFPELGALTEHLAGHRAVLDGEVVALDHAGRSDFQRLQARMHLSDPAKVAELGRDVPISYVVFDLLLLDDHLTIDLPYVHRRRLLAELIEPTTTWSAPPHQVGDGAELFAAAAEHGLEGIMAKRLDSPYRPGLRSPAWRKCKVRRRQEVVIGGWSRGEGGRSNTLGSLLVGVHDRQAPSRPLLFAGGVGTGFTDVTLDHLRTRLADLATNRCPFTPEPPMLHRRHARWVEPLLVAEVAFAAWSTDGRLRHPSYIGLRNDKDPGAVVREPDPHERPSADRPGRRQPPGQDLP